MGARLYLTPEDHVRDMALPKRSGNGLRDERQCRYRLRRGIRFRIQFETVSPTGIHRQTGCSFVAISVKSVRSYSQWEWLLSDEGDRLGGRSSTPLRLESTPWKLQSRPDTGAP